MLFIEYPKCSTCQKAKKWLEEHNITYTVYNVKVHHSIVYMKSEKIRYDFDRYERSHILW